MKITAADYHFWTVKQAERAPKWAKPFSLPMRACVHTCINRRVNPKGEKSLALSNLLSLLGVARRNIARGLNDEKTMRQYLRKLSTNAGTVIEPEKREQWARRFLVGIARGESRRVS